MPDNEAWGQWSARLHAECGPLAAAAWAAIRRRMGPQDEPAFVGLASLAADLGRSTRTAKRTLHRLAEAGWLIAEKTGRASMMSAVVAHASDERIGTGEHIERGQKCPLRGDKSVPSEGTKVSPRASRI